MSTRQEETRPPLQGIRVVNTRSPRQARELDELLEQRRAHPLSYPCIDTVPASDTVALDAALKAAVDGQFDWLVFTSANAAEAVGARLDRLGISPKRMGRARVAAVGPGTAAALTERLGLAAELCPQEYLAEALADELLAKGAQKVLVPQAERAREALVSILTASGVEVQAVVAYRTVLGSGGTDIPQLLRHDGVDAVVFASPSAVDNMSVRLEREGGDWDDLRQVCIACIGPVTAAAAERRGLGVDVLPADHTILGLVQGLEQHYRNRGHRSDRPTGGWVP